MNLENQSYLENLRAFDEEPEKQTSFKALFIFALSLIIFVLTALGFLDTLSTYVSHYLLRQLGYTNKWSLWYGPEWFIGINRDVAALAGLPVLLTFMTIILIYYNLRKQSKRLWRLVFIIVGGGLILLIAKYFFAPDVQSEQFDFFNATEYKLPSGHAMMGTIFYLTLAVTISRRQHSSKTKRLTIISGIVLIILIGISRILPGIHSLKDVVAGWSLGLVWLCLCWFVERYIKKASDLQKRSQQVL